MADDPQFDTSTLTGLDPSGGSPLTGAVQPPMAPPPAPETANMPISGNLQPPAPPDPVSVQGPPTVASGQSSVWKNIAMGALGGAIYGLAGSAGQTHFGGGAGAGAGAVLQHKQQEIENTQRSQQLQMESVRAADTHIAALDEHNRANQLSEEHKLDYAKKSADYQAFLQDNFGIEPNLSFNDQASEATGAHSTLAGQNGGTIPPVSTVQQPSPDGTHGKVAVYSPSQQQMQQNANGFRELINTQRAVQGQPPIDNATFNSLGFKGQRDAAQQAITFLKPTPSFSMDKNKPDYLPAVLAQRQQQLAQYQANKDANGNPDANPNVQKQLQDSISYLQNTWDSVNKSENKAAVDSANAMAPVKAQAAADAELAKNTGTAGQSAVDLAAKKSTAETVAKNAVSQNMLTGSLPDGTQVAGTPDQLTQWGATGVTKLPSSEQSKVTVARQLVAPTGLFSNVEKDLAAFKPQELDALTARWKEFDAGTLGKGDPRYVALRTDTKLLSTAMMQAHVGSKGSEGMMEHFGNLADSGKMDAPTLASAIATEKRYVQEKAMLPKSAENHQMGDVKTFPNGAKGVWDGKGYVKQ